MPPRQQFLLKQVTVNELIYERGIAMCTDDRMGTSCEVPLRPIRGRAPQVGESWVVDRALGNWAFAAAVTLDRPVVEGDRVGVDPLTLSLLEAMTTLGFVIDATTIDGDPIAVGAPGTHYTHDQVVSSADWFVVHGLNYKPNVAAVDLEGNEVYGTVTYLTLNTLNIHFSAPFSGTAYLS
jgi:hypothetical protein